ncbi:helix-turn-helix transcriptional regulator [Anaerovorax odorimutans]|uniref:Helix-turn-helix transcriptional regulator n=1 Tax=Anaerovorax odorimutans TaxID=109327 RepID=A0ABT1RNF2_9FIRM|nr:helix-turn-helix transcriptional regulator [Anaerovorax odorimutans]MCQ4636710.1 helix-turn-helix transcriptional regulator [Anaerovorax odorimutans]
MSNNVFNFIYIAVIILGGMGLTLSALLRIRERDKQNLAILLFVAAMFLYMVVDFITYYFLNENVAGGVAFALITVSDILFSLLIVAWLNLIIVMLQLQDKVKIKWCFWVSVLYQIGSQALSISLGRYDSYLMVETGLGKIVLQTLNAAYVVFVIGVCLFCFWQLRKKDSLSRSKNLYVFLLAPLILYMLWIAYWDYSTWYRTESNLNQIYGLDPLLLLYALLSLFLIYYFVKKDPLKLGSRQVAPEDAVAVIARQYGLSAREEEVLNLLNCGQSNPQIAGELSISENTVKRHINHIFRKTETQSRHEIIYKISNVSKIDL